MSTLPGVISCVVVVMMGSSQLCALGKTFDVNYLLMDEESVYIDGVIELMVSYSRL